MQDRHSLPPTHDARPERLEAAFAFADDRASYLDIEQAVERALAPFDVEPVTEATSRERAELVLRTMREATAKLIVRKLDDPAYRRRWADALAGVVIP